MISPPTKKKRSFSSVSAKPAKAAPNRKVLMVCSVSVAQGEAVQITASLTGRSGLTHHSMKLRRPMALFLEKYRKKLTEPYLKKKTPWMDPFLGGIAPQKKRKECSGFWGLGKKQLHGILKEHPNMKFERR